jgi:hypothetical protein
MNPSLTHTGTHLPSPNCGKLTIMFCCIKRKKAGNRVQLLKLSLKHGLWTQNFITLAHIFIIFTKEKKSEKTGPYSRLKKPQRRFRKPTFTIRKKKGILTAISQIHSTASRHTSVVASSFKRKTLHVIFLGKTVQAFRPLLYTGKCSFHK